MRLIDADALDKSIIRYAESKHFNGEPETASAILKTRDKIREAPIIDAVTVVHASLIETGFDEAYCKWGDCTNCGTSNIWRSKYCCECGAKLDGDPHDSP